MNSWFGTIRKKVPFKILYAIMNKLTDQLVTYQQMYENIQNPVSSKLQSILNANYKLKEFKDQNLQGFNTMSAVIYIE